MKKPVRKSNKKSQKNHFEERFNLMVKEYQDAQEVLEGMDPESSEYLAQKKVCDKLFANAERYLNRN